MEGDKVTMKAAVVQTLATFAVSSLSFLTGMIFAWPSYNMANFVSNQTVLSEPMSSIHVSLLGSLTNIGGFLITPFCGLIVNKLGRKNLSMLAGIPFLITWTIVSVTNSVHCVLLAMAIAGWATGGQVSVAVYISEIADQSIRGALMSVSTSVFYTGLLFSYALGGYLSYNQIVYIQLSFSVVYILVVSCLKESPTFLILKGREKEAARSVAFYKQVSVTSKEVELEIAKLKWRLDLGSSKMLEGGEDPTTAEEFIAKSSPKRNVSQWQFLRNSSSSIRGLIISVISIALMMLMGNAAMQTYAETLFKEVLPSLNSNQCSVYLAIDLLMASILCTQLIDRFGRRCLLIATAVGSSICTLVLGTIIQYHWAPHWFTVFLIYFYNFIFNMGVAVVPFVLATELFLPEVRGLCSSIVFSASWALNFISTLIFAPAVETYGFGTVFYGFTIVGFVSAIFSTIFQPETNGLSADRIQTLLLKKNNKIDLR